MTEEDQIGGDGGPMIVLQASAIAQWQGAADFENSLMNGGYIETDYDLICESNETGRVVKRYDREMLVLDDSSWGAYIFTLPSGAVAIVQQYVSEERIETLMDRVVQMSPTRSFPFDIQDTILRLSVGAEDGQARTYGYRDVYISPGIKSCDVFESQDELVIIINAQ